MIGLILAIQAAIAPPPPPPIIDCFPPGPFIVFFARDAATLGTEAQSVLNTFVRLQTKGCSGPFTFSITGHADRGERAGVDRRRAASVRAFLVARGLRGRIGATRWVGTAVPRVLRPAGIEDLQNRRVELDAVPDR